jgi:dTDP-glucose 4,6-dehydratase
MNTVVVTGGCGFIGSWLVKHLLDVHDDWRVVVLDALTYAGRVDNLPVSDRLTFYCGNVCDTVIVDRVLRDADMVVHAAAETHVTRSIVRDRPFAKTDVLGTQTVLEAAARRGVKRVLHVSTSEVYGTALLDRMDESHPLHPRTPYAAAKLGADALAQAYWHTRRLPIVIARPFNVYGQRQHLEKLIPRFAAAVALGEPLTIHGDGSAVRDWTHVADVCRALDLLLTAEGVEGEVFNIGSGMQRSVLQVAEDVYAAAGRSEGGVRFVSRDRPGQVARHACDAAKVGKLGWRPEVGWHDGVRETVQWYLRSREWWEVQLAERHVEIEGELY